MRNLCHFLYCIQHFALPPTVCKGFSFPSSPVFCFVAKSHLSFVLICIYLMINVVLYSVDCFLCSLDNPFVYFYFCCSCFWYQVMNSSQDRCQEDVYLSSKSFTVSHLVFQHLTHFSLFLFMVLGMDLISSFCILHLVFSRPLVERIPLSHCVFFILFSKICWPYKHEFVSNYER